MYIRFVCHANLAVSNSSSKMNKHTVSFENRLDKSSFVRACPLSNDILWGSLIPQVAFADIGSANPRSLQAMVKIGQWEIYYILTSIWNVAIK